MADRKPNREQNDESVVTALSDAGKPIKTSDLTGDFGEPVERILERLRLEGCVETVPGSRWQLTDMGRGMLDTQTITTTVGRRRGY